MRQKVKLKTLMLGAACLLYLSSCSGNSAATESLAAASKSVSSGVSSETNGLWTNLTWENNGDKMGDNDGPAYVVYSKEGYNKASQVIKVSRMKVNLVRKSDGKSLNGYAFLGMDVYNGKENQWVNCIDAGLGFIGSTCKCHACVNRYSVSPDEDQWWESSVELDMTHDYKLVLDASQKDEQVTLTIFDVTEKNRQVDSKTFTLYYAKKDGGNLAVYQDYAMDFPEDVRLDTKKVPSTDWEQITLYNTDEDLYMKNIVGSDLCLYNDSGSRPWTADRTADRYMWPDKTSCISYVTTTVTQIKKDSETKIDLNMNR
ncbi:hypothetical protein [Caproicibacter fermentans]|uniref:Lipoprotein n=1 Tax=Caproicibacter fermentans TaxID=2576756 RepID=A0A7G8TEH2_9FIRM|nr:hypothetical protein [Caproicibacter fermentans]QNK42013.1 hypothetical protein HCR03_07225 [Caproicibacter fermentans]